MVLLLEALVAAGVVFLFYVFMAILTEKVYAACKKEEKEEKDGEEPGKNPEKESGKPEKQEDRQTDKTAD